MRLRAITLLLALGLGGCAGVGSPSPPATTAPPPSTPSPSAASSAPSSGLGVSNSTSIPVTLAVNGQVVETVEPGIRDDGVAASLPPMPWKVEARAPSGRVLTEMDVAGAGSGRIATVDLSCGRVMLWYGPPPAGEPSFVPPSVTGDCN